jgi:hypothetical protein
MQAHLLKHSTTTVTLLFIQLPGEKLMITAGERGGLFNSQALYAPNKPEKYTREKLIHQSSGFVLVTINPETNALISQPTHTPDPQYVEYSKTGGIETHDLIAIGTVISNERRPCLTS